MTKTEQLKAWNALCRLRHLLTNPNTIHTIDQISNNRYKSRAILSRAAGKLGQNKQNNLKSQSNITLEVVRQIY